MQRAASHQLQRCYPEVLPSYRDASPSYPEMHHPATEVHHPATQRCNTQLQRCITQLPRDATPSYRCITQLQRCITQLPRGATQRCYPAIRGASPGYRGASATEVHTPRMFSLILGACWSRGLGVKVRFWTPYCSHQFQQGFFEMLQRPCTPA